MIRLLYVLILPFILSGCTLSASLLQSLVAPPANSDLYGHDGTISTSPYVNFNSSQNAFPLKGHCPTGSNVTLKIQDSATHEQTYNAVCTNNEYTVLADVSGFLEETLHVTIVTSKNDGTSSTSVTRQIVKDVTAPTVAITQDTDGTPKNNSALAALPITGTCTTDDLDVEIFAALSLVTSVPCTNGTFTANLNLTSFNDGLIELRAEQKDVVGNKDAASLTPFEKDTLAPAALASFTGLGASPSNSVTDRTVTLSWGTDVTHYKAVVAADTSCLSMFNDLTSSTEMSVSTTYSLQIPADGDYRVCAIARDQAGNWQTTTLLSQSTVLHIDTVSPALSILLPLANSKFNQNFTISGSCEDGFAVTLSGPFTGSPESLVCTGSVYSKNITLTGADGAKIFTVSQTDASSNTATDSVTVLYDTVIAPPVMTLTSGSPTNLASATFTAAAGTCSDATAIYISELNQKPGLLDIGWVNCSELAAFYSYDLSLIPTQGYRNIRFFAKDAAGNISNSSTVSVLYDSLPPQMVITHIPTLSQNSPHIIRWTLTEASVLASSLMTLEYQDIDAGSGWVSIGTKAVGDNGPLSAKAFTYTWAGAPAPSTQVQIRIRLTDQNGNEGIAASNIFNVVTDNIPPVILASSFKINGELNPADTVRSYVKVSLQAQDTGTFIGRFCIKALEASAPAPSTPLASDNCWVAVNAPQPGLELLPTLDLVDFDLQIGMTYQQYNLYAWVEDGAGLTSTNAQALHTDFNTIEYIYSPAPTLNSVIATNTPTPQNPPLPSETTFTMGQPVYISWRASDGGTPITNMSMAYSTDGVTFHPAKVGMQDVDNLANNSSNGTGCAYSSPQTGCFVWPSTISNNTFFKLKIFATDAHGQTSIAASGNLNSGAVRLLAGNQDPGHDGDAHGTVFNNLASNYTVPGTLLVTMDGKIFYRDSNFGIIYINPKTNVSTVLLSAKFDGTLSSGDGVPVSEAVSHKIIKIALDYQDRILVYDAHSIRRIETRTDPMTIETIIGAQVDGTYGQNSSDVVPDPRDLKIQGPVNASFENQLLRAPFFALPNGDIYFVSEYPASTSSSIKLRVYKGSLSNPHIESIHVSGTGTAEYPSEPISSQLLRGVTFTYDPETSAISKRYLSYLKPLTGGTVQYIAELDSSFVSTGTSLPLVPNTAFNADIFDMPVAMDGSIYVMNRYTYKALYRLKADATWEQVLGNGTMGDCAGDGTVNALDCPSLIDDVFINRKGQIYFSARGIIKTVYNGKVYTLNGQRKDAGDGGRALDMRISNISFIDHGVDKNVILLDSQMNKMREITPGQAIEVATIAGDGTENAALTTTLATAAGLQTGAWSSVAKFATNPATGEVYTNCAVTTGSGAGICRLNRTGGRAGYWDAIAGGGSTPPWQQTSMPASNLAFTYVPDVFGFYNNNIIVSSWHWNGAATYGSTVTNINLAATPITADHLIGTMTGSSTPDYGVCADGSLGQNCQLIPSGLFASTAPSYIPELNGLLYSTGQYVAPEIYDYFVSYGGVVKRIFTNLPHMLTLYHNQKIYICSGGDLYYMTFNDPTQLTDPARWPILPSQYTMHSLPKPHANMSCGGRRMLIKAADGATGERLVYVGLQNGLPAIMEYFLPN